jgi:hypothetical protein
VAADPIAALTLSHAEGGITAKEMADELKELRSKEIDQDREDLRARIEFERERDRTQWEAQRLDRERQLGWDREDRANEAKVVLRREVWEREDQKFEREERRRELEAKLEVIREAAKHGHMDSLNLQLDKVVNNMLGGSAVTKSVEEDDRPQLESGANDEEEEFVDDEKVRVEDAH